MFVLFFMLVVESLLLAVLFGSAGRLDLPWFWAVMGVHFTVMVTGGFIMDPGLRKERIKPGPGGIDRAMRWIAIPFILLHLAVAGMDVGRYGWSGTVPTGLHAMGLAGYIAGMSWVIWAVSVNRFFSPVVRIQQERGHHVITAGPYRFIRHPGYAGSMFAVLCEGVALGSYWSLLPVLPVFPLMIRRAVIEDRFLRQNLPGYMAYAQTVRYGLLPGIW